MKTNYDIRKSRELEKFGDVKYSGNIVTIIEYTEPTYFSELDIKDISYKFEHDCLVISPKIIKQRSLKFLCFIARTSTNNYNIFLYTSIFSCLKSFNSMRDIIEFLHLKSLT